MEKKINKKKVVFIIIFILIVAICVFIFIKNHVQNKKQINEASEISIENDINILKTSGAHFTLKKDDLEVKDIIDISDKNSIKDLSIIYKLEDDANLYSTDKIENDLKIGSIINAVKENGEDEYTSDQVYLITRKSYPMISLEEMGLETEEEAYQATQLAIWEICSRTGENKDEELNTRIDLIIEELEEKKIEYNKRVFDKAKELVKYVEKFNNKESIDGLELVPELLVDNSLVKLTEQLEKEEDRYLVGPYSFVVKNGYFKKSNISVKDENGNQIDIKLVDISGNEFKSIVENTEFYLSFKELPQNIKYYLTISAEFKRVATGFYEYNDKRYIADTYVDSEVPVELTINFETKTTLGEIDLTTRDINGNLEIGKTVILYDDAGEYLGRSVSGSDSKINYYKVPEGKYKLVKLDENGEEENSKEIEVIGGEITSVNL